MVRVAATNGEMEFDKPCDAFVMAKVQEKLGYVDLLGWISYEDQTSRPLEESPRGTHMNYQRPTMDELNDITQLTQLARESEMADKRMTEEEQLAADEAEFEKQQSLLDPPQKKTAVFKDDGPPPETKPLQGELVPTPEMAPVSTLEIDGDLYSWTVGKERLRVTMGEARSLIANPTKSGKEPNDKEIVWFLKQCAYQGLNPFIKDAYLVGYDNRDGTASFCTIVAYQAYLKRAAAHPAYNGKESGVLLFDAEAGGHEPIVVNGDVWFKGPKTYLIGGWACIHRKDRDYVERQTARLVAYRGGYPARGGEEKQDPLSGTKPEWVYQSFWKTDPSFMISKCAVAKAIRSAFPFDLGNFYIPEEVPAMLSSANGDDKPRIGEDQGSKADEL